jgi:T5SS/PEP-CTERM-associated repeat protein
MKTRLGKFFRVALLATLASAPIVGADEIPSSGEISSNITLSDADGESVTVSKIKIGTGYGGGDLTVDDTDLTVSSGFYGKLSSSDASSWYYNYVGYSKVGTLTVTDGGSVKMSSIQSSNSLIGSSQLVIGYNTSSTGTLKISGSGSLVDVSSLTTRSCNAAIYCGYSGDGEIEVSKGGSLSVLSTHNNAELYLGYNTGSTGTLKISGYDSSVDVSSSSGAIIYCGYSGAGEIEVSEGSLTLSSTNSYATLGLGYATDSTGTLKINGSDSSVNLDSSLGS